MPARLFTQERDIILDPLKAHRGRMVKDKEEFERMTRASEIMLTAEEPSIRTYFCAKNVVTDYILNHPNDPRGYKELGKVHLYSCVPENIDLAEEAFQRVQSLSGNIHAEGWYLWSMCHRIRLFGYRSRSSGRMESWGAKRLTLPNERTLSTLQSGISASQQTQVDAEIFQQLGRFGISCIIGLRQRGRQDTAKQVGMGSLQYYRQAIEIGGSDSEGWKSELANAEAIVDQLVEQASDLADFSTEPDFNPSGPISLERWLTTSSPVFTQHGEDHSSAGIIDLPRQSSSASSRASVENLTNFLDRIENQAQTYQDGSEDSLLENFGWPLAPSRQEAPRFMLTQAGTSVSRVLFKFSDHMGHCLAQLAHTFEYKLNPCCGDCDSVGPTSLYSSSTSCSMAEQKSADIPPPEPALYNLPDGSDIDEYGDGGDSRSPTCTCST
ncbi:hypothetical protein PSHT_06543 [Puccinia striiformis]|uniref:Uncharacterized protein n=1 Tax=Puccinia striiformis TaxID=27350 RepID=A0A2S4W5F4_9BASI|nr:hypothetical protein PSHT_06543 [Puccinia striiformis]